VLQRSTKKVKLSLATERENLKAITKNYAQQQRRPNGATINDKFTQSPTKLMGNPEITMKRDHFSAHA